MKIEIPWFEKYRAKTIDEYIFPNEEIRDFAKDAWENEKIKCNTLFYGKPGLGKSNLAQLLIRKVIKSSNDLFVIKERSVKEIDEVKIWIQKPPYKSKQKIVFCEESDRLLQSKQAIAELKTITEKYLEHTVFFFITNYISKFATADKALLTRFTCKFEFKELPKDKVLERLKYILEQENIRYDEQLLKKFVEENIHVGLRELINKLQICSLSGEFKYTGQIVSTSIEDELVNDILNFINVLTTLPPNVLSQLTNISSITINQQLYGAYTKVYNRLQNDLLIDYEYVLESLLQRITFIPLYNVTLKYLEEIEYKKYKNYHLLALLYEYIKILNEFS